METARIVTGLGLARHMAKHWPASEHDPETRRHIAGCVLYNSNSMHDPKTGRLKFLDDTPDWVFRAIAIWA